MNEDERTLMALGGNAFAALRSSRDKAAARTAAMDALVKLHHADWMRLLDVHARHLINSRERRLW